RLKIQKHLAKSENVIVGRIIRELHSCDYNSHTRIFRLHLLDDLLKILLDLNNRHSSKGIVDPELQNEDIDLAFQVRREPLQAAFRGAAGRAGVGYLKLQAGRAQFLCEQHRVSFVLRESETLGETVAPAAHTFGRSVVAGLNEKDCPADKQREPSAQNELC